MKKPSIGIWASGLNQSKTLGGLEVAVRLAGHFGGNINSFSSKECTLGNMGPLGIEVAVLNTHCWWWWGSSTDGYNLQVGRK